MARKRKSTEMATGHKAVGTDANCAAPARQLDLDFQELCRLSRIELPCQAISTPAKHADDSRQSVVQRQHNLLGWRDKSTLDEVVSEFLDELPALLVADEHARVELLHHKLSGPAEHIKKQCRTPKTRRVNVAEPSVESPSPSARKGSGRIDFKIKKATVDTPEAKTRPESPQAPAQVPAGQTLFPLPGQSASRYTSYRKPL